MTMQAEAGVGFQASAELSASLGRVADEMQARRQYQSALAQSIHPVKVPPQQIVAPSGTSGSLNQPNMSGPMTGNYWDVRHISIMGFSAGTVTVYLNAVGGDVVAFFSAQGVQFFGKGQILLGGNDNLVFSASTITTTGGVTMNIAAIEVAAPMIGDYLL